METTMTLSQAINIKKQLLDECVVIATKFKTTPTRELWNKLEDKEEDFEKVTTAIQDANSNKKNNSRIKQRELLVRRLEVLQGVRIKSKDFKSFFEKTFFKTKESLIKRRIKNLANELSKFNTETTISVNLKTISKL